MFKHSIWTPQVKREIINIYYSVLVILETCVTGRENILGFCDSVQWPILWRCCDSSLQGYALCRLVVSDVLDPEGGGIRLLNYSDPEDGSSKLVDYSYPEDGGSKLLNYSDPEEGGSNCLLLNVSNYHSTWCCIWEDLTVHQHHCVKIQNLLCWCSVGMVVWSTATCACWYCINGLVLYYEMLEIVT